MNLRDWLRNGWLVEHETSAQEISDLLAVAERDLKDCRAAGLSPDGRLGIAYNAALQASKAALAAAGYRAGREAHHYRAVQSLAHTIKADAGLVTQLDAFRKKRNTGHYDRAGIASEQEAIEMTKLAARLKKDVTAWLRAKHPNLLSAGK